MVRLLRPHTCISKFCLFGACLVWAFLTGGCHSLKEASAAPVTAHEKIHQNTIKWSTASELNNFGFDVYRGLSAGGPFTRLNVDPIEGGGTTDEPRRYAYVDDTIDPRLTYYYYVESISMSGQREKFTPVGRAAAKIPPENNGEQSDPH